jgi:hypothetical protein
MAVPLSPEHARATQLVDEELWCNEVPFFLCAKAVQYPGGGTDWISMGTLTDTKWRDNSGGYKCFFDTDGRICLLANYYPIEPNTFVDEMISSMTNPPVSVEHYMVRVGELLDLGAFEISCKAQVVILRVDIPAGLPTNLPELIADAGLQNDDVARDMAADYGQWRSVADHIRRIKKAGDPAWTWFRERTLPRLVAYGLVLDAECTDLMAPESDDDEDMNPDNDDDDVDEDEDE